MINCPFCNNKFTNNSIQKFCNSHELCKFVPILELSNNNIVNWDSYCLFDGKKSIIESNKLKQITVLYDYNPLVPLKVLITIDYFFEFPSNGINDLNHILDTIKSLMPYA